MSETKVQSFMNEGIVLFDDKLTVTYANFRAEEQLVRIGHESPFYGQNIVPLLNGKLSEQRLMYGAGLVCEELQFGSAVFELKAVPIYRHSQSAGGFVLIRDVSDLKEKEKQLLIKSAVIKEIHHRVKNNLQTVSGLLRLQMRRTHIDEVKRVYRDSIQRINSIAIIHEMLAYEGQDSIRFREVADRIAKNMISSITRPDQLVNIDLRGDDLTLPSEKATTLALIVNELIQNCVTHAFGDRQEGHIDIVLRANNQLVQVRVADDGIGIGSLADIDPKEHLGLKIVETLVQENLGGVLEIIDTGVGTEAQITFPLKGGDVYDAEYDYRR